MNDLERRLAALAPEYPFPATPDLAGAAGARLGISGRRRRPGRLVLALAAMVAAFAAVLAVSPGARGALTDWLDFLPGVRVERVDELPSMPLASWTGVYGEEVTLAEAERQAPFEILLPESLGEPDLVYRYRDPSGGLVITAVYGDERDARLVLTQWTTQDVLFHKLLGPVTQAELVDVREARGPLDQRQPARRLLPRRGLPGARRARGARRERPRVAGGRCRLPARGRCRSRARARARRRAALAA